LRHDEPYAAEQLMAAFVHAPSGVALVGADGRFLHVNPALAHITGRPEEELAGLRWQDLVGPDDRTSGELAVTRAIQGTGELEEVVRIRRPDGREREVRVTARAVGGSPGNPARLVAHVEDVTERRAQERRMRRLTGRIAALLESAPDAIVMREDDGTIATWNPAAEEMFGLPAATAIGRSYEEVVYAERDRPRYRELHARVSAGETITVRMRARRADGAPFPVQVSAAPLVDRGRAFGAVAIIRDITELAAAERELADRAARLQRSNTDLEAFAYTASHDLQEPLRSITLAAGTVLEAASERLEDDERQLLSYIDEAAGSMGDRVAALMQVARLRLGEAPDEPVPVEDAVEDAIVGLRAAIREAGAEIDVRRPLPSVPIPRSELALVLQNLIGNAIKFRRPGEHPHVTVSGSEHDGYAELEVADDGVGLSESDRARIFRPFQRAVPHIEGTGLGLAVVTRIAERRAGTVSVDSEGPGRGARFTLRVPSPPA
jgi:PAS domain S-box-containing protein